MVGFLFGLWWFFIGFTLCCITASLLEAYRKKQIEKYRRRKMTKVIYGDFRKNTASRRAHTQRRSA